MESGAQPASAPASLPPEELHPAQPSVPPGATTDEPLAAAPANEIDVPAPSSSPRPIAEPVAEHPVPRHTPPPESGKQVAASSAPPDRRSVPPTSVPGAASLEGHTLIGGWREPGLFDPNTGLPGEGLAAGVPVPAPAAPTSDMPSPPSSRPPPPVAAPAPEAPVATPAQASSVRLTPESTRPELPQGAAVATFDGAVPAFAPSTFGELLDATLGL
jgi:hypothetical protein